MAPAAALEHSRLGWQEEHANFAEFQKLQRLVDAFQYEIYVLRVSSGDSACFGRRRMRPKRSRQPDSHGRDPLVAALQSCGLTFRLAGRVIGELVDIWRRALAAGESIKLPIGRLLVRNEKIVFRPSKGTFPSQVLPLLAEKSMPSTQKDHDVACQRCGGVWFSKQEFHQYAAGTYGQRVGEAVRVLCAAQDVYVCVCGYPRAVSPLVRRKPDSRDFHAAVQCAQQFVAVETVLKQSFAELANTAVTKTEMNTLRRRVASLESEIARLAPKGPR